MSIFSALETLLSRQNQRFICIDNGWPTPGADRHVAHLQHLTSPPLDADSIAALERQVGDLPELVEFYRRFGSLRLYCDTVDLPGMGLESAYYIAPPADWPQLKADFEGWLEGLSEDEREELLPPWIDDYLVIGEVPSSGNYFLVPLQGTERGKIYAFDHDGFEFTEGGANLAQFLNSKSQVTAELLHEILTHTRYYDGHSSVQWLCESYHYDP